MAGKLRLQWSPQQIAGWLRRAYRDDEDYHVTHETIYRSLRTDSPKVTFSDLGRARFK